MNERFRQFAERITTSASRRQFIRRLGRVATTAAGVLGILLAFAAVTVAHRDKATGKCCAYECMSADGSTYGWGRRAPCHNELVNGNGDDCVLVARYDCGGGR